MNDFLKFAVDKGMNSMHVEKTMNASASYISPSILEERQLNVTQMDVFSRLMMDRIIFLGTEVNDYTANVIQAQLLYLDSVDSERDINIYLNTPGGSVYAGLGSEFMSNPLTSVSSSKYCFIARIILCPASMQSWQIKLPSSPRNICVFSPPQNEHCSFFLVIVIYFLYDTPCQSYHIGVPPLRSSSSRDRHLGESSP